jgi:hypothetical protein
MSPTLPLLLSNVRLDGDTAIAGNDQNWQYRAQSRQARRAWRVLRRVGNVHRVIVPESTERLGRRDNIRPLSEQAFEKTGVQFRVAVRASVTDNQNTVVLVHCVQCRREHNAAGEVRNRTCVVSSTPSRTSCSDDGSELLTRSYLGSPLQLIEHFKFSPFGLHRKCGRSDLSAGRQWHMDAQGEPPYLRW